MAKFLDKDGLDYVLKIVKQTFDAYIDELMKLQNFNTNKALEEVESHIQDYDNPHKVTKEQLGYSEASVYSHVDTGAQRDHVDVVVETSDAFGTKTKTTNVIPGVSHDTAGVLEPDDKVKLDKLLFDDNDQLDASILPSFVDDVYEGYLNEGKFYLDRTGSDGDYAYSNEKAGESGKIYIDLSTTDYKIYMYSETGKEFVLISDVPQAVMERMELLERKTENLKEHTAIVTKVKGVAENAYRTDEVEISPDDLGITVVNNTKDRDKEVLSATKLATGRNISLSGAATGNATEFDGTKDIEIPVTELDSTKLRGIVPEECLPSYVDDVLEGYYNEGRFYKDEGHTEEYTGETGKIYVDLGTGDNKVYRFASGDSGYILISDVPADTVRRIDALETKTKELDPNGTSYVPTTTKVNGHELKEDINVTKVDIGLGNVTNYDQAKAIYIIHRVNGTIFECTHLDGTKSEFDQLYDVIPVGSDTDTSDVESITGVLKSVGIISE